MVFSLLATIILIFSKKQNKTFEEQFSKESFIPVRGLLAAIIVFTHAWINGIYNNTISDSLISLYSRAGYLVVSVFSFCLVLEYMNPQKEETIILMAL